MTTEFDIVIVGAGMVGASMACSLANSNYSVAVIEPFQSDSQQQPSFDERTVALTYSSKLIFEAIDVWSTISPEAYPILSIEVTNQDSFGFTSLDTQDSQTEALGYVVPTRRIGLALHQRLAQAGNIQLFCPAQVKSIQQQSESATINIETETGEINLTSQLVILADGGRSNLLQDLGFKSQAKPYTQSALVSIISTDQPHQHRAFEHFCSDGPLALLPLRTHDYALAWTLNPKRINEMKNHNDDEFLNALQAAFGQRAGQFTQAANRNIYPLSQAVLSQPYQDRVVIIGNAAHVVHPVAGQGFNLGLRDVGFLHEVLTQTTDALKQASLLSDYAQLRQRDTRAVSLFTDGLIRSFTSDFFPVPIARNVGLSLINLMPSVKRQLLRRTMGLHGRQSQLAMTKK